MTFGLLGSNKRDTPLAPTRRPRSIDTAFGDFQIAAEPQVAEERSLLNILSLGMIGDSGTQEPQEESNEDDTTEN